VTGANTSVLKRGFLLLLITAIFTVFNYLLFFRPQLLNWGARNSEIANSYPCEDRLPRARILSTHVVEVHAPARQVWPWLVQIGQDRAGFYTYDFLEKALGTGIHNANRLEPSWQQLHAGDKIKLTPMVGLEVAAIDQGHYFTLSADSRTGKSPFPIHSSRFYFAIVWTFYLSEESPDQTRLIARWRADWGDNWLFSAVSYGLVEWGAFIMERRMLMAIRDLAENRPGAADVPSLSDILWFASMWIAGFGVLVACFGRQRRIAIFTALFGTILTLLTLFILPPTAWFGIPTAVLIWTGALFSYRTAPSILVK
jgi:hypothetical protein